MTTTAMRFFNTAGPQLLLQAFLQRIVNSGGRIERAYGLGRMRTDLLILWPAPSDARPLQRVQKAVVECKLFYKSLEQTVCGFGTNVRVYGSLRC